MTTRKQLLHLVAATVSLLCAAFASADAHPSSAHVHKSPVLTRTVGEKLVLHFNKNLGVATIETGEASVSREKTTSPTEPIKAALAPTMTLDEDEGMSTEGAGCVREGCACDAATHGNPWCYSTTRGDCPNHQGLLCVWSN